MGGYYMLLQSMVEYYESLQSTVAFQKGNMGDNWFTNDT